MKIKTLILMILVALLVFSAGKKNESIELYVSVVEHGNPTGSMSKPFASIPQAVEALRVMREEGSSSPATIYLREGRHVLTETLVLGLKDGYAKTQEVEMPEVGAGRLPQPYLSFVAYSGETPLISSGVAVEGWYQPEMLPADLPKVAAGKVWVADFPEGIDKFYTLYDAIGRLNRARATGFVPTKMGTKKTVNFPKGKLKNWDNLEDVELNIRPSRAWMINMLPLASVDEAKQIATTKVSATYAMGELAHWVHTRDGCSAWIENTLEALDEAGEWVIDSKKRKIYLWPANPAEDGAPQGILVPATTELIRVEGDIDYDGSTDVAVKGIAFRGITFSHADRWAWTNDEGRVGWGMQHDWDMFDRPTALLRFRGSENCTVTKCTFKNSGGSAVRFDLHAKHNRVKNCEMMRLGEAGILLSGYGPGTKDVNHHNRIINNHIHHFSEITWHSPGIWAWQSGHNQISNNYIHHSGYAGVLVTNRVEPDRKLNGEGGRTVRHHEIDSEIIKTTKENYENWKVREKYNHSRHNVVENNEITHCVQLLSDGNCIYVSGAGTGNIVRHNYLHDNLEHSMPAPIRCDDDQHETLIYGNVIYNNYSFSAGIASKGVNDIINNVIAKPLAVPKSGYLSFEWVPVSGSKVQHNIIISNPDGGIANNERPRKDQTTNLPNIEATDMDANLYYHPNDSHWMDAHFVRMRKIGKEKNSAFGDPMFIDPDNGNFGFKEGSPAIALGIEPLDVSQMGLRK